MKNIILAIIALAAVATAILYFGGRQEASAPPPASDPSGLAEACAANGGSWNDEAGDCETGDRAWCEREGGMYAECASACRTRTSLDAPPEVICTLQCVQVCRF